MGVVSAFVPVVMANWRLLACVFWKSRFASMLLVINSCLYCTFCVLNGHGFVSVVLAAEPCIVVWTVVQVVVRWTRPPFALVLVSVSAGLVSVLLVTIAVPLTCRFVIIAVHALLSVQTATQR